MSKKNVLTHGKKQKADEAARQGKLEEARTLYSHVCRIDPMDIEAWVKLGLTEKRLGKYAEAEQCCRRALAISPSTGLAHYALGAALQSQGRIQEAINAYRLAVKHQPDYPDAHYWLGNALHASGALSEAINCYQKALAMRPAFAEALGDLGAALLDIGEVDAASDILQRGLKLRPADPVLQTNMAHALRLQGKVDEAIALFRQSLRLSPETPEVIAGLAGLLEKTGALQEARDLTESGLIKNPDHPSLNLIAAQLDRRAKHWPLAIDRLERVLTRPLSMDLTGEIELTLGQIQDEAGNPDKAFPLIVSGNQKKAQATLLEAADRHTYLDRVATIAAYATPALGQCIADEAHASDGMPDPVFLIGFPRSGTTLMEQILDSHPRLQTMEEKGCVSAMVNAFLDMANGRLEALTELDQHQIDELRQIYLNEARKFVNLTTGSILIDKMPLNTVGIPIICRIFPKAKFILAIRHPCDVCLSCLMQNFAVNAGMASFFSLEDTVQTYAAVMGAWQKYVALLPLNYHRIRYEDLIGDIPGETRKLLNFLNVEWNDAVLDHTSHAQQRRTINTPSYHQVTQPIYQNAKYRWKRYEQPFAPVLPVLQPFIEYFGY